MTNETLDEIEQLRDELALTGLEHSEVIARRKPDLSPAEPFGQTRTENDVASEALGQPPH
jgi:hypothetical protein